MHVLIAMALFATWPFTRLVHAFSAPIGYLFRPYVVYRRRAGRRRHARVPTEAAAAGSGSAPEPSARPWAAASVEDAAGRLAEDPGAAVEGRALLAGHPGSYIRCTPPAPSTLTRDRVTS